MRHRLDCLGGHACGILASLFHPFISSIQKSLRFLRVVEEQPIVGLLRFGGSVQPEMGFGLILDGCSVARGQHQGSLVRL